MTSKEALKILEFGGVGYKPVEKDEAVFTIEKDLEILEKYRKLFKLITTQQDKTLEYSTIELEHYYKEIENN